MHVKYKAQASWYKALMARQKLECQGENGCFPATGVTSAALTHSKTATRQTWLRLINCHSSASQVCHAVCDTAQGIKYVYDADFLPIMLYAHNYSSAYIFSIATSITAISMCATSAAARLSNECNHVAVFSICRLTCLQLYSLYTNTCLSHNAHLLQQPLIHIIDEVQQDDDLE